MAETDNPLKSLILTYKETFAEWLMGKRLRSVRTLTIELPATRQRSDLLFEYDVIRLWELDAEEVLQLDKPALLALVGQMHMVEPGRIVPAVLDKIAAIPDGVQRNELLTALINLIGDEGVLKMVERMIDLELLDTPYLRRVRQQSWEKGVHEGRREGVEEGRREGVEEGRREGAEEGRREGAEEGRREGVEEGLRAAVLAAISTRFNPQVRVYQPLEQRLRQIHDVSTLSHLLEIAITANALDEFQSQVEAATTGTTIA